MSGGLHISFSIRIVWNRELRPPKIREAEPKILDYLSKTYSINRTLMEIKVNPNDDHTSEITIRILGKLPAVAKAVAHFTSSKLKSDLHSWIKSKLKLRLLAITSIYPSTPYNQSHSDSARYHHKRNDLL